MEPSFAYGCAGALVRQLQQSLSITQVSGQPAFDSAKISGQFDDATRAAVRRVQADRGLPETGTVDAALWKGITNQAWPSDFERALQLLGAFEGHGYTKATGNYDHSTGMTWGIAGFTMVYGGQHLNSLHTLLTEIFARQRAVAVEAFGKERAEQLEKVLNANDGPKAFSFAKSITDPTDPRRLLAPWQADFAELGKNAEVQRIQNETALELYWKRSQTIAKRFYDLGMDADQTRQLMFELLINPGSMTSDTERTARELIQKLPSTATVPQKLRVIAELYARDMPRSAKDILERKGTIADGFGRVHGISYRLAAWGLDVHQPALSKGLRLAVLGFEERQVQEQLVLSSAADDFVNAEAAVELREWWPADNGTELLVSANGLHRSLSLRPLLRPNALGGGETREALGTALSLTFAQPIGILALFGQSPSVPSAGRQLVFGKSGSGHAGLAVQDDGSLRIVCKSGTEKGSEQSHIVDIGDIRSSLAKCRLVLLYCGNGIPSRLGEASAGTLLRKALARFGGRPLVLGWFGNGTVPRDADQQFVAPNFFARLRKIAPAKSFEQLCVDHEHEVVQSWGAACFETFSSGRQRFLWRDGPFASLKKAPLALQQIGISGAGALRTDNSLWQVRADYKGSGDSMAEVKPK